MAAPSVFGTVKAGEDIRPKSLGPGDQLRIMRASILRNLPHAKALDAKREAQLEAGIRELPPGKWRLGDRLYLEKDGDRGRWGYRFYEGQKERWHGLGGWPAVTWAQAEIACRTAHDMRRSGQNPIDLRRREKAERKLQATKNRTVAQAFRQYIAEHRAGWRNLKHANQWDRTFVVYINPKIGGLPVGDITTEHVLEVLRPIWTKRPETASRVRGRIEKVLAAEIALGSCPGPNPAQWINHLQMILPGRSKVAPVKHHAALDWHGMPEFMSSLREHESIAAWALEFLILTAARTGEIRLATWHEINLNDAVWEIPAPRMKANRDHRVPLSPQAVALLHKLGEIRQGDLVFEGMRANQPLSDMALTAVLRRMGRGVTAHGMRATFKTWASDETTHAREVIEASLAHSIGDRKEQAYQRGSWFDRRRALMNDWGRFCFGDRGETAARAIAAA